MKIKWDVVLLTFFITSLIVGFFLTVQLRVFGQKGNLEALNVNELAELYNNLNAEVADLKAYIQELRLRSDQYHSITGSKEKILKSMDEEIRSLKIITGAAGVEGEGVEVQIFDEKDNLQTLDLVDMVNELRAAGAVAIAINNVRVIANTSILKIPGGFEIDGVRIRSPFIISAVGEPETLYSALTFPGGIVNSLEAIDGVAVIVEKRTVIYLPKRRKD